MVLLSDTTRVAPVASEKPCKVARAVALDALVVVLPESCTAVAAAKPAALAKLRRLAALSCTTKVAPGAMAKASLPARRVALAAVQKLAPVSCIAVAKATAAAEVAASRVAAVSATVILAPDAMEKAVKARSWRAFATVTTFVPVS